MWWQALSEPLQPKLPLDAMHRSLAHRRALASIGNRCTAQHTKVITITPSRPFASSSSKAVGAARAYDAVAPIPRKVSQSSEEAQKSELQQFIPATDLSANVRPGGRSNVSGIIATVFGCSGQIGRYIVQDLGDIGSQVIVPYRGDGFNTRHLKLAGTLGQVVPVPYDLTDPESIKRTIARSNVVINLIGKSCDTASYTMHDTNVKIAYQLAKAASEVGVERFIHVSHINADPNSDSEFFRTKGESELAVRHFYPDATILRPATVYGREDMFIHNYASLGVRMYSVPVVRGGNKVFSPVYVEDVSRAILNSIIFGESVGQTYHLAGPNAVH